MLPSVQNSKQSPHQGRMLKVGTFLFQRVERYHQISEQAEVSGANHSPEFFQHQLKVPR